MSTLLDAFNYATMVTKPHSLAVNVLARIVVPKEHAEMD